MIKTKGRLVSQTFEETQCRARTAFECTWPECQCPKRGFKEIKAAVEKLATEGKIARQSVKRPRALRTSVVVKHRVSITHKPIAGCATYRAGKLVFIISGSYKTRFFNWATIKTDGTLGRINIRGYWS